MTTHGAMEDRAGAGSAATPDRARTFALIPGAGGSAWYWHRIVPPLRAAGHDVVAIDLPGDDPGAGLPEYAALVRSAIADRPDVVLVAASLGGFTAAMVAGTAAEEKTESAAAVTAVVLVNAMIPLPGETPGAWWERTGQPAALADAARRGGYSPTFDLATYFLHDVPADVARDGEAHQHEEAAAVFGSSCDFAGWPAVPMTVIAGRDDRFFPAAFQRRVARDRLGVEAEILPGGHLIALARPETLVRRLLEV